MLQFVISLLILHVISAQNLQCSNASGPFSQCPVSYGGYHFLCAAMTYNQAVNACASLNLQIALLAEDSALQALYTMQQCALLGTQTAWVGGWNGMGADPCAFLDISGGVVVSPGWNGCNSNVTRPVICQDLPPATVVATAYVYAVTMTGTSTSTSTLCTLCGGYRVARDNQFAEKSNMNRSEISDDEKRRRPPSSSSSDSSSKCPCNRRDPSSCHESVRPRCPFGPCTPVCPFNVCGLRVVQAPGLAYADAAEQCARYGWHLADITSGQHADIAFLQRHCTTSASGRALWVRSFNGIDGALCIKALPADPDENVPIGYGVAEGYCGEAYALCQDSGPAPTGTGVFDGLVTAITTENVSVFTTITVPSSVTTTTLTKYFTRGCNY